MIPSLRKDFNHKFDIQTYQNYVQALQKSKPGSIGFPVAETPVFIDADFKNKMIAACEAVVDVITGMNFKQITRNAIPEGLMVYDEDAHTHFIAFDFGICMDKEGYLEPKLIEMQGFPSLFCFEMLQDEAIRQHFNIPEGFSIYLNGYDKTKTTNLLKEIIIGDAEVENVILLELFPHEQKTKIDFYCTEELLNIETVCITEVIKEGTELFYNRNNKKIKIKRVYNRIIFDELQQQEDWVKEKSNIFFEPTDVKWIPHPNWFFRISKFTLPFLHHKYIPETHFLRDRLGDLPSDLSLFVLKPLFSFAGQGVLIDVTIDDIEKIQDPHNWILQKKVKYADVIETPDGFAKAEIRIFYMWKDEWERPVATHNLARLSKGKMIGVRHNENKTWVGGTIAYFEENNGE